MCSDNKVRVHPRAHEAQFVRVNGWTKPIHYLQFTAWFLLFIFALCYFGVVAIALQDDWKPAAYVCVGVLYIIHAAFHIAATTINPADDGARVQMKQQHQMPRFDRTKHAHVIENEYCHLCETYVSKKSKHCRACNKCVKDFDHHCLWLNNCVGSRNYRYFLATISSALVGALVILTVSLFVFINAILDFQNLDKTVWWRHLSTSWILFEVFIGILSFLCIMCVLLLGQLLCFHIVLIRRGISTYDYIQQTRSNEKNGDASTAIPEQNSDGTLSNDACMAPDPTNGSITVEKDVMVVKIASKLKHKTKQDTSCISGDDPAVKVDEFVTVRADSGKTSPVENGNKVQSNFTNEAFHADESLHQKLEKND